MDEPKNDPIQAARDLLAADRERREGECSAKLQALLDEYGCGLSLVCNGGPVPPGWVQVQIAAVR